MVQVDFCGRKVPIYNEHTGTVIVEAEIFVAILPASGYIYCTAVPSQLAIIQQVFKSIPHIANLQITMTSLLHPHDLASQKTNLWQNWRCALFRWVFWLN